MTLVDSGEMVVRVLKAEGVRQIFSLSGQSINPIYNACLDHGIRIIDTRHEQAAAFMADAWGRLTGSPTIALDGGDIYIWALRGFQAYHRHHLLTFGPLGQLGVGVPFAMAAKLLRPEAQVMVLTGDGAFGYQAMEFDTAVRHGIPIVCVIANDGAWGMIKNAQIREYGEGRAIGTELRPSRYEEIVKALGGYGRLVEKPEEIRPALEEAFASGLPACINVMTA